MLIKITKEPIDTQEARTVVRNPFCGAVAVFEGMIRGENDGKKVLGLEYEVYPELFSNVVQEIIREIRKKWDLHEIAFIQRVGKLDVGETGIVIATSSPHRREALEALSYALEEFKKRVPVWKKEYYLERTEWIPCTHEPPAACL